MGTLSSKWVWSLYVNYGSFVSLVWSHGGLRATAGLGVNPPRAHAAVTLKPRLLWLSGFTRASLVYRVDRVLARTRSNSRYKQTCLIYLCFLVDQFRFVISNDM